MESTQKRVRVLVVDDDHYVNVDILSYHLRRLGRYEPISAFNVEQFKQRAAEANAVILDIRLPNDEDPTVNHWGGLQALNDLLGSSELTPETRKCLSNVIIRSGRDKDEATTAGISIPPCHAWLSVDAPLSKLVGTLDELTSKLRNGQG